MKNILKKYINLYKFKKGQNQSGAKVLEINDNLVTSIERQDGTVLKKGDKVLFRNHEGKEEGPWEINFFNIYQPFPKEVKHCSAAFTHTSTYVLSIGLLKKL